jgi:uncharacterized membrane protein (UPF0127 family)
LRLTSGRSMPLVAFTLLAIAGCQVKAAPAGAPAKAPPPLLKGSVTVHGRAGPSRFEVELALNDQSRERGLMFRTEVAPGTGMLFVFPEAGPHAFWMKNTLVPLDMVFLGADRHVVGVIENAEPQTLTSRDPGVPSQYVLEVASGTAFARGFRVGDLVDFEGVPAQ